MTVFRFSLISLVLFSLVFSGCRTKRSSSFVKGDARFDPLAAGDFVQLDETLLKDSDFVWAGGYDAQGNYIGEGGEFDIDGNWVGAGGYDENGVWTGKGLFDSTGKYIGPGGGYDEYGNFVGPTGPYDKSGTYAGWSAGDYDFGAPGDRLAGSLQDVQGDYQVIQFNYDRAEVPQAEMGKVTGMAEYLTNNPQLNLVVEGHCDERGSEAYNMALGEQRALAVRAALVMRGVEPSRVTTLSFGEEAPVNPAHNDNAWRENRRAEMKLLQ